tara:strand:- start:313 stop:630 length:318 start_codon:yes stop_codon:yes gene_type:complete
MIDEGIWETLEEDFSRVEIYEMNKMLDKAEEYSGWAINIVPQTLFEREYCSVCATFYSKELGELWLWESGRKGRVFKYKGQDPRGGYRACIEYQVKNRNPFWPGW